MQAFGSHLDPVPQRQRIDTAEVLQPDVAARQPLHLEVAARDRLLVEPRDHHPAAVEQGTAGVNRLARVNLPTELDNAVELAGKNLPILVEHPDQHRKSHRDRR